jgi:hypothetical protein
MPRASSARSRAIAFGALLGAGSTLASCGDSSGPEGSATLVGRYEIALVGDEMPPVFVHQVDFATFHIVDGALEFLSRGRVSDQREFETRALSGVPAGPHTFTNFTTGYRLRGEELVINRSYGSIVYSDTGRALGDTVIELRVKTLYNDGPVGVPSGAGTVVRYHRVAEVP